jgi:hypothetical protein
MNMTRWTHDKDDNIFLSDNGDWVPVEEILSLLKIVQELADYPTKTDIALLVKKAQNY